MAQTLLSSYTTRSAYSYTTYEPFTTRLQACASSSVAFQAYEVRTLHHARSTAVRCAASSLRAACTRQYPSPK